MKKLLIISFWLIATLLFAQEKQTQTIRGRVYDYASQQPLIGVIVIVNETQINTVTDENGNFILEKVPIGRQIVETQYMGYETYLTENLIISISKEAYLEIGLNEKVEITAEVVVSASRGADGVANKPINDLSVISTRSFSVDETKRYAASLDDPGRMAVALPGVQTDEGNENDVIIRGNSSFGILWKVEGLDVINPSHFARAGSTGGGVSVFSASVLGTTDFSTGAFSSEYGNAFSGVFDMRFRKGNMNKREHSIKIGLIGLGFSTEGPIKKGQSSYLINYRYSTLGILNAMGMYVVRDNVTSNFQDISFNLSFNSKDNKTEFKIFGIGGISDELWEVKDTSEWQTDWDYQYDNNGSNLGILGFSYRRLLDNKSYIRVTLGTVYNGLRELEYEPQITDLNIRDTFEQKSYNYFRNQLHIVYSNKLNTHFRLKTGLSVHAIAYGIYNKERAGGYQYHKFIDHKGLDGLLQGYVSSSYRPSPKVTINFGVHAMLFTLNNTYSIDPRIAIQYKPFKKTTITAAYGLHGKVLAMGTYWLRIPDAQGNITLPNKNLDIMKMHHAILGFQQVIGAGFRANLEIYYQYASNVPVGADSSSSYSFINQRDGYGNEAMVSQGLAQNYGIDLTLEKAFSRNFFILLTGSLFESQFKTLRQTDWLDTRTNKRWASTMMAGYEFQFKKGATFMMALKSRVSGGLRYTPINFAASQAAGYYIDDNDRPFSEANNIYFRLDTRFAYRKNYKKASFTIAIDIQNTTATKNVRHLAFDRQLNQVSYRYETGLLPVLSFQLDF